MDEPQVRMQPRCIVMMVNDHGGESSFFTLESVREIREKRAALKADIDMGLGEGGEADESGLLNLVGLDLYSDGDVESFELSINPAFIGHVKQLTDRAWKSKLVSMGIHPDENKRLLDVEMARLGDSPPLVLGLKAAGIPVKVLGPGRYWIELDDTAGELQSASHQTTGVPLLSIDAEGGEMCCCGHTMAAHRRGSRIVEDCGECALCGIFHRHLETDEGHEPEQTEEQPAT
jgi:hypothetical protein